MGIQQYLPPHFVGEIKSFDISQKYKPKAETRVKEGWNNFKLSSTEQFSE